VAFEVTPAGSCERASGSLAIKTQRRAGLNQDATEDERKRKKLATHKDVKRG